MQRRVALIAFLIGLATISGVAGWWNASRSVDVVHRGGHEEHAVNSAGDLASPMHPTLSGDREVVGERYAPAVAESTGAARATECAAPLEPLIVTAHLPYPVPGLADDRFTLYLIDPSSPLAPYGGTPLRLDRTTEVPVPADLDLVQLQVSGNGLVLDPLPLVRNPAGAEIELVLDVSGTLVVRVLEPWLGRPNVMVYATGSDRRDVWTEVMEGRGKSPDAKGECRFDGLPPGSYWVQTENSESREDGALRRVARVQAGRTTTLEIGGPEPAPLLLEGTVTRDGQPLSGADVRVGSFELVSGMDTKTDAHGRFEVSLRGPGRYRFRIDGHTEFRDVDVLGTPQHFDLPGKRLCVIARDVEGTPLVGARVELDHITAPGDDPRHGQGRVAKTLADGTVCLEGLEPGRYLVTLGSAHWFYDANERMAPQQLEVEVPAPGPIQLVASPPSSLSGVIEPPPGMNIPGMSIYLRPTGVSNAAWRWQGSTTRGNQFHVELAAAGEYELLAICEADSHRAASEVEVVQLPRVASDPVRVTAHRSTRLVVEARDVDGAPLRLRLAIWTDTGTPWPHEGMNSQAQSRQTSLPVPPGTYDVYGFTPEGESMHARVEVSGALVTQRVVLTR